MDLSGRTIWQHAAGDTDRSYADVCTRWDVILTGPGADGPWPQARHRTSDPLSSRKLTDIARFVEEMRPGDLVILRLGTSRVCAVGELTDDGYGWNEEFGDVDGWDLQHFRRVRWWTSVQAIPEFPAYAMKLGDATQRLGDGPVRDWLGKLQVPETDRARPLADLSALAADGHAIATSQSEIADYLFGSGVASSAISTLMGEMGELARIANWYRSRDASMPSERETVAYLVIPLLRALGWTPQRMAVEWNLVDIALFSALPRSDDRLSVVVEAKRMDKSCLAAQSQAWDYARGRPGCERLIVTDGLRYGVYRTDGGEPRLHAYLNLTRLRDAYPVYGCHGARHALLAMAPEWRRETDDAE